MNEMIMETNKKENVQEKKKNTGFSLVELIVVIAIMAILAVVIAPQIIKYIERGRIATDTSTASMYETAATTAIANEEAYKEVISNSGITVNVIAGSATYKNGAGTAITPTNFKKEFEDILENQLKAPAESGKTYFEVEVPVTSGKIGKITSKSN